MTNAPNSHSSETLAYDQTGNQESISNRNVRLTIEKQPSSLTLPPGSTAVFSVKIGGGNNVTFQWRKGRQPIPGADGDTLTIANVTEADEAAYSVIIRSGRFGVVSRPARLFLDTDRDGMADAQERRYFRSLDQTGTGDLDNDGITNAEELEDGTDPRRANSKYFRLDLSATNGSISASPRNPTGRYRPRTPVSLTATPAAGFRFLEWQGSLSGPSNPRTVIMTSDQLVIAKFANELGDAVDAPQLPWTTSGDGGAWAIRPYGALTDGDGDSAQSPPLQQGESTSIETYIAGPAEVTFITGLLSDSTASFRAYVDDNQVYNAGKSGNWQVDQTFNVPSGLHLVRWVLEQPNGVSPVNATAWLDEIHVTTTVEKSLSAGADNRSLTFTTDRLNPWFGADRTGEEGGDSMRAIINGQHRLTWLETRVRGRGVLYFRWREVGSGTTLELYIDGERIRSAGSSWGTVEIALRGRGEHIIQWRFDSDTVSNSEPYGTADVDRVVWNRLESDLEPGSYQGLIEPNLTLNENLGGVIGLRASRNGNVSGYLLLGNRRYAFRGSAELWDLGSEEIPTTMLITTIRRRGVPDLSLEIQFDPDRSPGQARGRVWLANNSGIHAGIDSWLNGWNPRQNPSAHQAGRYNAILDLPLLEVGNVQIPQGNGFLTWNLSKSGTVRWSGQTGDGERLSGGSILWPNNQVPLYSALYRGTGSIFGLATLNQDLVMNGEVRWLKSLQAAFTRTYPDGFGPITTFLAGGRYEPPQRGEILLDLPNRDDNLAIVFGEGGIDSADQFAELDQVATVLPTHRVLLPPAGSPENPAGVRLTLNPRNGLFSGNFRLTDLIPNGGGATANRPVSFQGVLIPQFDLAACRT